MFSYFAGLFLGLSLILPIGAQNAFILRQGIKKQHIFLVCLTCTLSDSILIALGVSGFGVVIQAFPDIEQIARYGGAAFVLAYAFFSFYASINAKRALSPQAKTYSSAAKAVTVALALTWLNPHVYLDAFVLLGSISTQYPNTQLEFALGAISASFIFVFVLGYGASFLAPIFENPKAWQTLDFMVGVMMLLIAASLLIV